MGFGLDSGSLLGIDFVKNSELFFFCEVGLILWLLLLLCALADLTSATLDEFPVI